MLPLLCDLEKKIGFVLVALSGRILGTSKQLPVGSGLKVSPSLIYGLGRKQVLKDPKSSKDLLSELTFSATYPIRLTCFKPLLMLLSQKIVVRSWSTPVSNKQTLSFL